jgi:hypothetical protein
MAELFTINGVNEPGFFGPLIQEDRVGIPAEEVTEFLLNNDNFDNLANIIIYRTGDPAERGKHIRILRDDRGDGRVIVGRWKVRVYDENGHQVSITTAYDRQALNTSFRNIFDLNPQPNVEMEAGAFLKTKYRRRSKRKSYKRRGTRRHYRR